MQDVTEAFRGSGFKIFANILASDPKSAVWAIPAPKGGNRAFCDRMNAWAQGEGQPGLGYIFWREGEEGGAGPLAKNIGPERTKQIADQLGLGVGDAVLLRRRQAEGRSSSSPAARAPRSGEELGLIDARSLRLLLDRRFPDVRMERGREEDRLLAQPVLDAELSVEEFLALDANDSDRLLVDQGLSSTTSSATASSCPPAPSATTSPRS